MKRHQDKIGEELRSHLLMADKWLNDHLRTFLKTYGITLKQWDILKILNSHKEEIPPTILEVSQQMIDHSDTSRIMDRLYKKGLIDKKPCTMDKRATRILIKEEGRILLKKIDNNSDQLDETTSHLSESEISTLTKLLKSLISDNKAI